MGIDQCFEMYFPHTTKPQCIGLRLYKNIYILVLKNFEYSSKSQNIHNKSGFLVTLAMAFPLVTQSDNAPSSVPS